MKEYVINAKLGEIAITVKAEDDLDAYVKAKETIAEEFGYDFSKDVTYEIEGEGK